MTTVVLADDEALLRKAMAALLPLEGDITVLAEAEDGAQAVLATLEHRPDVLVIDLEMPGVDGLGAVAGARVGSDADGDGRTAAAGKRLYSGGP